MSAFLMAKMVDIGFIYFLQLHVWINQLATVMRGKTISEFQKLIRL
jgi:hypothetical protein